MKMMNLLAQQLFFRQPYKDRMGEGVKDIVQKYWLEHALVSLNSRDVI